MAWRMSFLARAALSSTVHFLRALTHVREDSADTADLSLGSDTRSSNYHTAYHTRTAHTTRTTHAHANAHAHEAREQSAREGVMQPGSEGGPCGVRARRRRAEGRGTGGGTGCGPAGPPRTPVRCTPAHPHLQALRYISNKPHTPHDTRHTTHDTRHTTHDTRHTTHDTRHTTQHDTRHTTHDTTRHTTHDTTRHTTQHDTRHTRDSVPGTACRGSGAEGSQSCRMTTTKS